MVQQLSLHSSATNSDHKCLCWISSSSFVPEVKGRNRTIRSCSDVAAMCEVAHLVWGIGTQKSHFSRRKLCMSVTEPFFFSFSLSSYLSLSPENFTLRKRGNSLVCWLGKFLQHRQNSECGISKALRTRIAYCLGSPRKSGQDNQVIPDWRYRRKHSSQDTLHRAAPLRSSMGLRMALWESVAVPTMHVCRQPMEMGTYMNLWCTGCFSAATFTYVKWPRLCVFAFLLPWSSHAWCMGCANQIYAGWNISVFDSCSWQRAGPPLKAHLIKIMQCKWTQIRKIRLMEVARSL